MRTSILLAATALMACGCAQVPSTVDTRFGYAVNAAKAAQVVDPDAPSRARAPMKSDGVQAQTALDQYEKSLAKPVAPTSVLNIGIGSGSTK